MREKLESNGFKWREGNSYALPQKEGNPQKVDQKGNQRWGEEEDDDDEKHGRHACGGEDQTSKSKPMDNPPPTLLGKLNEASEERWRCRVEYGRELLAATRAAKRAVLKAQRSRHAAEDAYSAQACKVLNRSVVVVHNVDETVALMELLGEAQPPYGLRTVEVRGPVTFGHAVDPLVQQMREKLEANGFELREGNSYALPQKVVPQKVDQKGNQRWDEDEDDDEWEEDE